MKRLLLPLTALLFVLLACGPSITPAPSPTHPLSTSTLITTPPIPTPIATRLPAPTESVSTQVPSPTPAASSPASFSFSLEYGIPGVAKAYAVAGILNVKPQPIFGMWGLIEPQRGVYNWKPLDDLVVEYQSAGFSGVQLIITAESPWASIDPPVLLHAGNTFPKQEFLDDYTAFVTRFVERYDGDGVEDAPGLRYPIHHYGLEREYSGFWRALP